MLRAKPVRNPTATCIERSAARTLLRVVGTRPRYLVPPLSWIVRPRLERVVQLDAIGTEVWDLCDGSRDLEAVIDAFADANGLTFHEARVAVSDYLATLMKRNLVVAAVPER
jgi:hypothetical protein